MSDGLGRDAIEDAEVDLMRQQQLRVLACCSGAIHDSWVIIYNFAGKYRNQF